MACFQSKPHRPHKIEVVLAVIFATKFCFESIKSDVGWEMRMFVGADHVDHRELRRFTIG